MRSGRTSTCVWRPSSPISASARCGRRGETLKKQNVKEIEALGLELDTDHHEAVARFDAGKEKKGKIVDVVQPGYKMGDKVLRFAKVVVGE